MMANVISRRALPSFLKVFTASVVGAVLVVSSAKGALKHQYTFNEGETLNATGRTIIDSISGANGTVIGPAAGGAMPTATANALVLPGGASSNSPYVDLPNGIISTLTNATFEGWYTTNTVTAWGRVFDFGSTVGGELSAPGGGGDGADYIFYSAQQGTNANLQRAAMRNNDAAFGNVAVGAGTVGGAESGADPNVPYTVGTQRHFAVVYNSTGGTGATPASISVYVDGTQRVTTNTAIQLGNLNDVNNWLGRSNWTADANFGGSFAEFRIYDTALNAQDVFNSFTAGPTGPTPPTLEVNRSTGAITLINQTAAVQIVGYTLTSAAGGLVYANWKSVADNYDANSASPTFDPDNTWTELTAAGSKVDFSEFDFSTGGTAGGSLGAGGALTSLQLGNPGAWKKSIYEDLVMDVRLADGTDLTVDTRFVGALPYQRSDLNFDSLINLTDWNLYLANVGTVFSNLTAAETYPMGDLNGDLVNNRLDFRLFKTDYNAANGAGAFEAMLAGVPEPTALSMLLVACAGLLQLRRRSCSRWASVSVRVCRPARCGQQTNSRFAVLATTLLVAGLAGHANAAVKHRYSFNEGVIGDASNRTIIDSVGSANGVVLGAGSSASASQLILNGGASATAAYVDLPNGIISDLTDASFEAWYTINTAQSWGRIFDFGSTAGGTNGELTGPGGGGNGQDFLFYSPVRGTNLAQQRVGFGNQDLLFGGTQAGNAGAGVYSDLDPEFNHVLTQQYHAVVVVDADGAGAGQATVALYINGAAPNPGGGQTNPFPVAHQLGNLNDVNNWLGRSNWTADANFGGSFNEFRIYDHAMSESEITNNFLIGPDAASGATAVSLQVNKSNGQVSLVNNLNQPLQIDYYELSSVAGALNPAGWTGIDGNTPSGQGWDKSGASNAGSLIELYLPEAGYTFPALGQLPIGAAFNPAIFGPGNDGDVQFGLVLNSGAFLSGNVSYVTSVGVPGDYSNNGRVDAADYVIWRKNPATFGGLAGYNTWRTNFDRTFGSGAGAAAAVPEPVALWSMSCAALVLCAWTRRKRWEGGGPMIPGVMTSAGTRVAAFVVAMMLVARAGAGTADRIYEMGDNIDEAPTIGGTPSSPGIGSGALTLDSAVLDTTAFSDASDLSYVGTPTYFNAGSGPLARPGAATGTFGLEFDGSSDLLVDDEDALGVPAQGDNEYITANGAPGYADITTRYIEGWVRPIGGAGTRRDVINDSGRFSIFINSSNNWAFLNGTTTVNSTTPAVLNTWTHVMHRTFGAGGGAALLVNGIAVATTSAGYPTGNQGGENLDLVIGAGLNQTSNFFSGQLDDIKIGVAGNNTGQPGGRNYGNVVLATDNDYVRQNLVGVNPGDINRDGAVNNTDINLLVTNWRRAYQVNGVTVGDLNSRLIGDLNMNGTVDIDDAYTLHAALRAAGSGAGLDFSLLGSVPEPSGALLLICGLATLGLRRKRRS
jgi:hypothetical protein